MKNKEIVKRLRDSLDYEFDLSFNDRKELLSYIEQLENNRNKALKIIDSYELGKYDYSIPPGGIIELREVLKGDSDENIR